MRRVESSSTGSQIESSTNMILDRLSKISGALRYKDKGLFLQITGIFNAAGRFEVDLGSDLNLFESASYELSLVNFATTSNITNVTETSNKFYFSYPGSGILSVTLPNGVYGIDELNATIQTLMQNGGYYNTAPNAESLKIVNNVNISANSATQKAVLQIRNTSQYTIYFNQPNSLYRILGFLSTDTFTDTAINAQTNGSYYTATFSTNPVDLTNGVLAINIGCSLIEGSVLITNNSVMQTQIIASKPYTDSPGSVLSIVPDVPLKLSVIKDMHKIRHFSIFSVDNNMKPLNFNFSPFVLSLQINQA